MWFKSLPRKRAKTLEIVEISRVLFLRFLDLSGGVTHVGTHVFGEEG